MYLTQAPLGRFVLGEVSPFKEVSVTPPIPTEDDIMRAGGCSLARVFLTVAGKRFTQLEVLSGSVTVSQGTDVRRVLEAELLFPNDVTPAQVVEMLHPTARVELEVEIGYENFFGGKTWFPLGIFSLTSTGMSLHESSRKVTVHCPDRVAAVKRALLLKGIPIAADTKIPDALAQVFADRVGEWLPLRYSSQTRWIFKGITVGGVGEDPWAAAQKICDPMGLEMVMNRAGEAEVRVIMPIEQDAPVAQWDVTDTGFLSELSADVDLSGVADGVIMRWGTGPRDFMVFPDETRRSYSVYSGDSTMFSGPNPVNQPELGIGAIAVAQLLKGQRGVETVSGQTWADPRVDVDNVIQLRKSDIGFECLGRLSKLSYTLGSPVMSFEVGERRVKR